MQKLQFTYHKASLKDVKAIGEAFSPQKRTSRTSKYEIFDIFLFLYVIFVLLLDTDLGTPIDPQHF